MRACKRPVYALVVKAFGMGPALTELQGRRGGVFFRAYRTTNGPRVFVETEQTNKRIALRVPRIAVA